MQLFDDEDSDDEYDGLIEDMTANQDASCSYQNIGLVKCSQMASHKSGCEDKDLEILAGTEQNIEDGEGSKKAQNEEKQQSQKMGGIPASITEAQNIKETRQSERVQDLVMQELKKKIMSKKRTLEGTNLDTHNSFLFLITIIFVRLI